MCKLLSALNTCWRRRKVLTAATLFILIAGVLAPAGSCAANYSIWTRSSLDKVYKTDAKQPLQPVQIKAAKNEYEAFQIALRAGQAKLKSVRIELHDVTSANGVIPAANISVYLTRYIHLQDFNLDHPDPLLPYRRAFDLAAGQTQGVWIDLYVPKDIPAGDYNGSITVSVAGEPTTNVPFRLHVYNFTLPDDWKCSTSFALRDEEVSRQHRQIHHSPGHLKTVESYYSLMLQHGVSAYNLPYGVSIFSEKGKRYLTDKRMTSFITPYTEDKKQMTGIINRYISLGMLDKAYYYVDDEPASIKRYEKIKTVCKYLHSINPDMQTMVTVADFTQKSDEPDWKAGVKYARGDLVAHYAQGYYHLPYVFRCKLAHTSLTGVDEPWKGNRWKAYWERVNPFDYLAGYIDIYCVSTFAWEMFESKAAERRAAGDTIWTYNWFGIARTDTPAPSLTPAIEIRYQPWLNYHYDNKGLLSWCVNWWQDCPNPWTNIKNAPWGYAEGLLLYPGYQVGTAEGVSSIRMKVLRDGLEDYQYLWMLEQKLGRQVVSSHVDRLVTDWQTFSQDPALLQSIRNQIATTIEANSSGSKTSPKH